MKDWKPFKDPESGAIFWYNHVTQVSQWECPFDDTDPEETKEEGEAGDDDEAVEVFNDDELGI